ncbi:hypothetical protein P8625_02165 [Tenacibaculum tangerinum]|uniref:Sugar-binding protein n=1 Tax=Tenacibaculum tangerinum TaxID=3038772 RepID=A0ABY8L402_9FLAO|nr:hypothetical protein [Tenacibaculum tangerinum]WGH75994.1 hypothetical protein P8625_02165 [Tenacibaculum tangerinum]
MKQEVDSIPNFNFKYAKIDDNLNFIPNKKNILDYNKSDYKGNVKKVITYRKGSSDSYKEFDRMDRFNKEGYKIESEYKYAGTAKYYYDSNNNLIKQINVRNGDTLTIKKISYDKKNRIKNIIENNLQENKNYEYNLDIIIEYLADGKPTKIINRNPNKRYTKKISYVGNKIIITRTSASKEITKEVFIYSKTYKMLKHKYGYHTIFNTYDEMDRVKSNITYRDNEYCCTSFYKYDEKGIQTISIFTNHLRDHKEIDSINYKLDHLDNIIYERYVNSVTNREFEMFYEFEYFDN